MLYFGKNEITPNNLIKEDKKYNLLDRVSIDNGTEIGTVSGFFTDANDIEYAIVCLDAFHRTHTSILNSQVTISQLQKYANLSVWRSKNTGKENTDFIQLYGSPAADWCVNRFYEISGINYYAVIPNILELIDIYKNKQAIKQLDPTEIDYPNNALFDDMITYSSTGYNDTSNWGLSWDGLTFFFNLTEIHFVIPILEIPLNQ